MRRPVNLRLPRRSEPVPLERGCYTGVLPLRAPHARTLGAEDSSIYIYTYIYVQSDCEATAKEEIFNTTMNKHTQAYIPTYLPTNIHTFLHTPYTVCRPMELHLSINFIYTNTWCVHLAIYSYESITCAHIHTSLVHTYTHISLNSLISFFIFRNPLIQLILRQGWDVSPSIRWLGCKSFHTLRQSQTLRRC